MVTPVFTGIVDHCGTLTSTTQTQRGLTVTIRSDFRDLTPGESVAVDGACLTVVEPSDSGEFQATLSAQTCDRTQAWRWQRGKKLNLERALRLGDRMGGHWVTGHVDTQLPVVQRSEQGEALVLRLGPVGPQDQVYLIDRGSVAVNGVSLTLHDCDATSFGLWLVPHTLSCCNLGALSVGDTANIEWDWMAKVVLKGKSLE